MVVGLGIYLDETDLVFLYYFKNGKKSDIKVINDSALLSFEYNTKIDNFSVKAMLIHT